jgi:hypothetical protein
MHRTIVTRIAARVSCFGETKLSDGNQTSKSESALKTKKAELSSQLPHDSSQKPPPPISIESTEAT